MTAGNLPTDVLPASQVAELINGLVKALRAFHMYLPNNPIYQRATENVRIAFIPIWNAMDELVLNVVETDFVWEEQVVYHQLNKSESLAWGLFKDGMRSLTIRRGAEHEELPRFLETINRARYLPTDAGDDLLTLLWEQEFQFIQYHFVEFFGEGGGALPEQTGTYPGAGKPEEPAVTQQRHAEVVQEAAQRPKGVVDLEEFDSTLYFLEESEINYVATEVEAEYKRDVRASALNILFDLVELEGDPVVRGEIIGILESLFPNFLNARDFRTAALVLREAKVIASRAPGLAQDQHQRLDAFVSKLSEPAIVSQLVQSLDEVLRPGERAGGGRGAARAARIPRWSRCSPGFRASPRPSCAACSRAWPTGSPARTRRRSCGSFARPTSEALGAVIALCGRLGLHQAVPGLGETVAHADPAIRLASVQTLAQLGTPAALGFVDKAIGDADRGVRVAAVRVAGNRGYKGALKRVEQVVLGKTVKDMDLTEKMAFFEAYGSIAGAAGLKALTNILLPRGLLKLKESPETRACAAIAIGKIRSPEAREVLQRAAEEKDLVVRNAVNRALREGAA